MAGRTRRWISGAIKRPGAFTAKARRAGMSVRAYARRMRGAPGRLGKQARLALTLARIGRRRTASQRSASARKAARTRARRRR